jgi:low affinity Fe/Cu permease
MKKIIVILFMMFMQNTNAVDIEINQFLINEEVAKKVIDYVFKDVIENKHMTIHTDTAIQKGKFSKCWNKLVYDGQGNPRMRMICY